MAPLKFICPATGLEVESGLDVDDDSFAALDDATVAELPPLHGVSTVCLTVQCWLGDTVPEFE